MQRKEQFTSIVKELSAEFLIKRATSASLITVTDCEVSPDQKRGTIFITVLPDSKETLALEFARRQLGDLRDFLKEKISSNRIPFLKIEIDRGEKNRQRIEELLKEGSRQD